MTTESIMLQIQVLDLLRNHPMNMQALIARRWSDSRFVVLIQTISHVVGGPVLDKQFSFETEAEAREHAKIVLCFD